MSNTKKYLNLEGLSAYHNELVNRLIDLEFDPNRMFATKAQLFSLNKWGADKYGRVAGLKAGLMITVGNEIWQLENPSTFESILRAVMPVSDKVSMTPTELGWKIVGNTVDFDVDEHTLKLYK